MIRTLWLLVSFAAALALAAPLYEAAPLLLDAASSSASSSDFWQLLNRDPLVEIIGLMATGAVVLSFFGFTLPALLETAMLGVVRHRVGEAHRNVGPKTPFTRSRLEEAMAPAPFLMAMAAPYVRGLVPVTAERKQLARRGGTGPVRYETLRAVNAAEPWLGPDALVNRRAFLWLFLPLPMLLWAAAATAAALVLARLPMDAEIVAWTAITPALGASTGFLAGAALFCLLLTRPLLAFRRNQAAALAADFDRMMEFQPVTAQIRDLQLAAVTQSRQIDSHLKGLSDNIRKSAQDNNKLMASNVSTLTGEVVKSLGQDIEKAIAAPLNAITDAAKQASEDQSAQVQQALRSTLKAFIAEIDKHLGGEIRESRALVKAVTDQATKLEKSYAEANKALAKQAKIQATDLSSAVEKAVKSLSDLEKSNQAAIKDGLASAAKDLAQTADRLKNLSETTDKLIASLEPVMKDMTAQQKALLAALKSEDNASRVIGSAATDLKAAAKAGRESVEAFVDLAEKMRAATEMLKNGASGPAAARGDGESGVRVGKSLRQLREQASKDLPEL